VNKKRLITALFVALAISGLFTFWLSRRFAKTTHVAAPQKQLYVAAARALEAGELLKPESLQLVEWPISSPITGGFVKIEDVAGRVVLYPLAKGEPILDRHLAAVGAGVGLSANIPAGMRALSVRSNEVVGVAGFLQPGAHVDVLLTYHTDKTPEPRTATVLQDVVVLAAGQQIHPDPEGKPSSVNVVTLMLTPSAAERLVLATGLGDIHFVLRNGSDREQISSPTIGLSQLTEEDPKPPAAAVSRLLRAKPFEYDVELILGDKKVVNSFR
jgi:pilus assembly protein CpaB